jgi:uncharacterized Tic20 family protein
MMDLLVYFARIFAVSLCAWGLYCLYLCVRIEKFIVKRYEQETDLLNTIYFREHATFTRYLPNFFSSALYTGHLLTFLWAWKFHKRRKPYRDIKDANEVIRYFSNQEIRWVKLFAISFVIIAAHGIVYFIFRSVWPEVFGR